MTTIHMKVQDLLRKEGRMFFTHMMTSSYYYCTTTNQMDRIVSYPSNESYWREKSTRLFKTRTTCGREKGTKWHISTGTPSPWTRKEGEEGELLFIIMLYPINYCPYAVPINRQQLHQKQYQLREKRNVQWQ